MEGWPGKAERKVVQATWRVVNQIGVEALERLINHFLEANPHLAAYFVSGGFALPYLTPVV